MKALAAVAVLCGACSSAGSIDDNGTAGRGGAGSGGKSGTGAAGKAGAGSTGAGAAGSMGVAGSTGVAGMGAKDAAEPMDVPPVFVMDAGSDARIVDGGASDTVVRDAAADTGLGDAVADASSSADAPSGGDTSSGTSDTGPADARILTDAQLANLLIEDFEDCNIGLPTIDGRSGYWYSYLDNYGSTMMPTAAATAIGGSPLSPTCSMHYVATIVLDPGRSLYGYGGVGVPVANGMRFDASLYAGISFMAKGIGTASVSFVTPNTLPISAGGFCTGICGDHFGMSFPLTNQWTRIEVPFSELLQGGWGDKAEKDWSKLQGIQFGFVSGATTEIWFDDLSFMP